MTLLNMIHFYIQCIALTVLMLPKIYHTYKNTLNTQKLYLELEVLIDKTSDRF